tara:strand:- start:411 stop:794 length:384 start_codon:yes stop_codon:yes gene_type:complete
LLKPGLKKSGEELDAALEESQEPQAKQEKKIYCGACGQVLTFRSFETVYEGNHTHVFQNPAGYTFEIALFKEVPGAVESGTPQKEHTWFAAMLWSYANCGGCGVHLGWRFRGEDSFWGLILTHLRYD